MVTVPFDALIVKVLSTGTEDPNSYPPISTVVLNTRRFPTKSVVIPDGILLLSPLSFAGELVCNVKSVILVNNGSALLVFVIEDIEESLKLASSIELYIFTEVAGKLYKSVMALVATFPIVLLFQNIEFAMLAFKVPLTPDVLLIANTECAVAVTDLVPLSILFTKVLFVKFKFVSEASPSILIQPALALIPLADVLFKSVVIFLSNKVFTIVISTLVLLLT